SRLHFRLVCSEPGHEVPKTVNGPVVSAIARFDRFAGGVVLVHRDVVDVGDRGCSGTAKRAGVCARVAHGGGLVRCGRAGLARTTCDDGDYRDSDQHAPYPHHTRIRARYGLAKEGYDRWASPPSAPTPGTGTRALPAPPDAGGRPRPRPCDPRR